MGDVSYLGVYQGAWNSPALTFRYGEVLWPPLEIRFAIQAAQTHSLVCIPCRSVRVRGTPLPSDAKRCRGRRWRYAKAIQAARTYMIPPWKCQRELDWGAWNSPCASQ